MADAEPGNTTYQRDLAMSYERIGHLAQVEGHGEEASHQLRYAADVLRRLHLREPGRLDVAEQLGVVLLRLGLAVRHEEEQMLRAEALDSLRRFRAAIFLTRNGKFVLIWAKKSE